MKKFFSVLSTPKKLALIAFVLGLIAVFAGSPYVGSTIAVNTAIAIKKKMIENEVILIDEEVVIIAELPAQIGVAFQQRDGGGGGRPASAGHDGSGSPS